MSALPKVASRGGSNPMVAKIHIAKKQLAMDEDTYRDTLERLTGHRSVADCSPAQMQTVMDYLRKVGFKPVSKLARKPIDGPAGKLVGKIEALWISGWNLGVIKDPSFPAMEAFVARQTGLPRAAWLKDAKDAAKVIDALKAWLEREGGVDWKSDKDARWAVIIAQERLMARLGLSIGHQNDGVLHSAIGIQKHLGKLIREALEAQQC